MLYKMIHHYKMRHAVITLLHSQLVREAFSLNVDKQCGNVVCLKGEYCSIFNGQCEMCSDICNRETHNYDEIHCANNCKDYAGDTFDENIMELRRNQRTILILLAVLLVIILFHVLMHVIQAIKTKANTTLKSIKTPKHIPDSNVNVPASSKQHSDGSQIFSMSGVDGSTVQTISTPISARYPAENSTIDYSYHNAALEVSNSGNKTSAH